MKYDFFTLSLLASFEQYLPFMSNDEIVDILEYGIPPSPWKIEVWKRRREAERKPLEDAMKGAISRQK